MRQSEKRKEIIKNIGKIIRAQRMKKEITQQQLGKLLNYSKQLISDWEYGRREPTGVAMLRLINFFGKEFRKEINKITLETHPIS